jgi:hypothetical protein
MLPRFTGSEMVDTEGAEDERPAGEGEESPFGTLVAALRSVVQRPPLDRRQQEERLTQVQLLLDEIYSRGVDASSLLRHGMGEQLWQPLIVLLIAAPREIWAETGGPIDFGAWDRFLRLDSSGRPAVTVADDEGKLSMTISGNGDFGLMLVALRRWAAAAPIEEIVKLLPPADEFHQEVLKEGPADEVTHSYRWLADRYGESDLEQWAFSSLQHEYRWRRGSWSPPFPATALEPADPDDMSLNEELARRAAGFPPDSGDDSEGRLMSDMKSQALSFLSEGRFREAAALFEFYIRTDPQNHEAVNNLAFCLLPIAPENALYHLDSLSPVREFSYKAMLIYNQCLALKLLGRGGEALSRAEYYWQRERQPSPAAAFLWREEGENGDLELFRVDNVLQALALLASSIATGLGREDRAARWRQRGGEE